jgi:hypothetical protein
MSRKRKVQKPVKTFNNPMSEQDVTQALNWYYNNTSDKLHKGYMKQYIEKFGLLKGKKNFKGVNEYIVDPTYSIVAKMIADGYVLPEKYQDKIHNYALKFVEELQIKPKPKPEVKEVKEKPINQQPVHIVSRLIGEIEYEIDKFLDSNCKTDFSLKKFLLGHNPKQGIVSKIRMWYRRQLKELQLSIAMGAKGVANKDIKEAYGYMTVPQRKRYIKLIESFVKDCEEYTSGKKQTRKPRKTKKSKGSETMATLEQHLTTL